MPGVNRLAARPTVAVELPPLVGRRRSNPWIRRALVFATCVLLLDALFGERGLAETGRARQDYGAAAADLRRVRQENAGLREQIRRLQHDPAAIEAIARRDLGLIKPGEVLVVVRDSR
jgi:cell division protein FtsB